MGQIKSKNFSGEKNNKNKLIPKYNSDICKDINSIDSLEIFPHNIDSKQSSVYDTIDPYPMSPVDVIQKENILNEKTSSEYHPAIFTWSRGGKKVYVIGSFDGWKTQRKMFKSRHEFTLLIDLPTGVHEYAFIVDGKRKLNPDQMSSKNNEGIINNVMTVKSPKEIIKGLDTNLQKTYSNKIPDLKSFKEPLLMPPHLNFILLNYPSYKGVDPLILPIPQHVTVNHLYLAEKKFEDVMVLGITQRFKTKFVTTIYYRPTEKVEKKENNTGNSIIHIPFKNIEQTKLRNY